MATISTTALPERLKQLLAKREEHVVALAAIDKLLEGIGAVLGSNPNGRRGPGRPPGSKSSTSAASAPAGAKKRRRRGKFSVSGEQSILAFIKENRNPTSQEIEKHWKGEGRGNVAANLLSKLVKAGELKREPLGEGVRGSRYSMA